MIAKLFQKILLVIIGLIIFPQTKATLPVKQCISLEKYGEIHKKMADISLQYQSELIVKKIAIIDTLVPTILAIEQDFNERITLLRSFGNPITGKEYLTINLESTVQTLQSKLDSMYQKLMSETLDKFPKTLGKVNHQNFQERLEYWQKKLISQIIDGISRGDYAPLISTLPNEFFLNAHIPNTFLCAFTFVTERKEEINIFVDYPENISGYVTTPTFNSIFTSGTKLDHSGHAILLQITALGGIIPTKKMKTVSGPQDLYRHSEQIAFQAMKFQDFINEIASYIKDKIDPEDNVIEIIFHGHTFRDMCSNCRATLVGHIINSIKKSLYPEEKFSFDSFMCLLQNKLLEQFGKLPIVTSVISSFLPYSPRTPVSGWDQTPPIDLLDPTKLAPKGICHRFVNQFAFSEAEFLSGIIKNLKSHLNENILKVKTEDNKETGYALEKEIISKLEQRLSTIHTDSLFSVPSATLDKK